MGRFPDNWAPQEDTPLNEVAAWLRETFPADYRTLTAGGAIHAVLDDWERLRQELAERDQSRAQVTSLLAAWIRGHVPHLPADGGSLTVHLIRRILGEVHQ